MARPPSPVRGRSRFLASAALVMGILALACDGGVDATSSGSPEVAPATATATVPATPTPEPTPEVRWPPLATARVITEDLNVRVGPGTEYLVLGRLQPGDEVGVSGRGTSGRWLALPGIGWVTHDESWVELTVPLQELPLISVEEAGAEFVGPLHPIEARSDIPVVDLVVDAVLAGDRARILGLVGTEEGREPGGAGTPGTGLEGSPAPVPPSSSCPDAVVRGSNLGDHIDEFLAPDAGGSSTLRLYAVVGTPAEGDRDAEFSIVFAFGEGGARQLWLGPAGGIEWFTLGCDAAAPGELLRRDRGGEHFFWLRPVVPEPLDPVE